MYWLYRDSTRILTASTGQTSLYRLLEGSYFSIANEEG
jgi:hypothetical protein